MKMNLQNLFNQFIGPGSSEPDAGSNTQGIGDTLSKLTGNIPGGLAGGAAAGGIMALLIGSKSARKFAGKAAGYGGAAVLGGLAYKAFSNWQRSNDAQTAVDINHGNTAADSERAFTATAIESPTFQLQLIKAMIAAAKADGEIDAAEQQRIFAAVEQMEMSAEEKGIVFDLLQQPIPLVELVEGADTLEQRSEIYLASCLVINADHPSELAHLNRLAQTLELPEGLARQLQLQATRALAEAA
jgi:uncharacterized membrane protein YebE (DUF533 family)